MRILFWKGRTAGVQDPEGSAGPRYPRLVTSPVEWQHILHEVEAAMPWFGQEVSATPLTQRKTSERLTQDDDARVLLSWLAGGSTSQRASRAGVGRRTVYSVLNRLIYASDPSDLMAYWHDLGLIRCVVTPVCRDVENRGGSWVVCLICHRDIGPYDWLRPTLAVGESFRPALSLHMPLVDMWRTAGRTQGHLILVNSPKVAILLTSCSGIFKASRISIFKTLSLQIRLCGYPV